MQQFLESADLLQTVTDETAIINRDAKQLIAGLTKSQLNWKPAPEKWSMAQCLEHLAVTNKQDEQRVANAIVRGRHKHPVNGTPAYRPTLMGGWLIKQLLPTSTRKMPAPKVFRPVESSNIEGALERFLLEQETFLRFVSDARGIDYNRTRLRSSVTPLMRFSLADAFVRNVVHCQRHLQQARRVRETPGFPK